jgi:hypothetical protein
LPAFDHLENLVHLAHGIFALAKLDFFAVATGANGVLIDRHKAWGERSLTDGESR